MKTSSLHIKVDPKQYSQCVRLLAAAHQRRRVLWMSYIANNLLSSLLTTPNKPPIDLVALPFRLIRKVIKSYNPDSREAVYDELRTRMSQQFCDYTSSFISTEGAHDTTPLIWLPRARQESAYEAAVVDMQIIAQYSKLLLPDPLPPIELYSAGALKRLQVQHGCTFRFHGPYMILESQNTWTCQACHDSMSLTTKGA